MTWPPCPSPSPIGAAAPPVPAFTASYHATPAGAKPGPTTLGDYRLVLDPTKKLTAIIAAKRAQPKNRCNYFGESTVVESNMQQRSIIWIGKNTFTVTRNPLRQAGRQRDTACRGVSIRLIRRRLDRSTAFGKLPDFDAGSTAGSSCLCCRKCPGRKVVYARGYGMSDFLADENFPLPSVYLLRNAGYEVNAIVEDSPGIEDTEVMARAAFQRSLLF